MKFKAPKNCNSATVDGKSYEVDKKGILTIPDDVDSSDLKSHGFVPADGADGTTDAS